MAEKRDVVLAQILEIMQNDYAGYPECTARNDTVQWLASFASAWKDAKLNDQLFIQYVRQYLAGFQDPQLYFGISERSSWQIDCCGFSVRRYGEELWVTKVAEDKRLAPGDAIVLLNKSKPTDHLSYLLGNPVNGEDPERQLWDDLVARSTHIMVRHPNDIYEDIPTRTFPLPSLLERLRAPTFKMMGDAAVLSFYHFVDDSARKLLNKHAAEIAGANSVIVDVRKVEEGMPGNMYCLVPLLLKRPVNLKVLMGEQRIYTRYSIQNATLRISQLERLLNMSDQQGCSWVQQEIERVRACAGKDFVLEAEFEEDVDFPVAAENQKAILLSDVYTSKVGEQLVAIALQATRQGYGKAVLVGRATRGSLDYSNLIALDFDNKFSLTYPISKTEAAHRGEGMLGHGLTPNVRIAFTPEECERDVVLEQALML